MMPRDALVARARQITNAVLMAPTAAQADESVVELLQAEKECGCYLRTLSDGSVDQLTCERHSRALWDKLASSAPSDAGLRALVEKWRATARALRSWGDSAEHKYERITLNRCADELDAALASSGSHS